MDDNRDDLTTTDAPEASTVTKSVTIRVPAQADVEPHVITDALVNFTGDQFILTLMEALPGPFRRASDLPNDLDAKVRFRAVFTMRKWADLVNSINGQLESLREAGALPELDDTARGDDEGGLIAFRRLAELSRLEEDWDTYGGLPPTRTAIEAAKHLLSEAASRISMTGRVVHPNAVMPFPNGGVQVIWERNADELQVDVGPTGDLGYLWIKRGTGRREAVEAEVAPTADILALVDQFLR